MTKSERTFKLYSQLAELGFTFEESKALRRIEMTLKRWAEAMCNGEIQRDEESGKPRRAARMPVTGLHRGMWPIADREAGALRRLKAIVAARNHRVIPTGLPFLIPYHQTDPRGCMLYLVKAHDLEGNEIVNEAKRQGCVIRHEKAEGFPLKSAYMIHESPELFDCPEAAALRWFKLNGKTPPASRNLPIESVYNRGLAVCA